MALDVVAARYLLSVADLSLLASCVYRVGTVARKLHSIADQVNLFCHNICSFVYQLRSLLISLERRCFRRSNGGAPRAKGGNVVLCLAGNC